ncbi:MAG: HEAT repeat domain-containing protein [Edaphobacter sp.]
MKNLICITLCSTAMLLPATTRVVRALTPESAPAFYISAPNDDGSYAAGTRAMDEHRWPDAVAAFDKVISQKGDRVDAALYWKAYSLNKLGKTPLAIATCDQLRSQFASSPWNRDCGAISVNVQVDAQALADEKIKVKMNSPTYIRVAPYDRDRDRGEDRVAPGSDEDLKILALNSLMHRDPATALPLLRGILSGNQSLSVKKHALFILAQNKSPEAESILRDAALGKLDPQLQPQAVQALAVFQGKSANDTLAEVYRTTTDPKIKKSVISAMFITKDAPRLVEMAKSEKDLQLKRDIVSQLALMNDPAATDYMMELLK